MKDSIPDHPNDRDYFFGKDGNIYQVFGYTHYLEKIHCLMKYIKVSELDENVFYWYSASREAHYKRVIPNYSVKTAIKNISKHQYQQFSKIYDTDFILYPKSEIQQYLLPRNKLKRTIDVIYQQDTHRMSNLPNKLKEALEIALIISDKVKIPMEDIGITGSILWDASHKQSDIDITIYGIENALKLLKNSAILVQNYPKIRRLNVTELMNVASKFSLKSGLSQEDCAVFTSLKPYLFYYNDQFLSIAFCPKEEEIEVNPLASENTRLSNIEKYSRVVLKAQVSNVDWGYFYPAIVYIKYVTNSDENNNETQLHEDILKKIKRIVIFEREISGYFNQGDNIEISGLLQKVEHAPKKVVLNGSINENFQKDDEIYQIVIGTKENYGNEYIKNLEV
ncbi:MAG: hypothetical protein GF364_01975 [Candidatus Lokiarchaeota archaeon]|nr:hypothetical protein [Candidatus Lokiarchaeota archaeon]